MTFAHATLALALALGSVAMPTRALPVVLSPAGGHTVALLAHDAHVHTEAFRKAVLLSDRVVPFKDAPVAIRNSSKFMTAVRRKVFSSTVSTFDYTPNSGGAAPLRIHARSGKSLDATLGDIVRHQTRDKSGGSTSEAGARVSDNEVAADAEDARFYPTTSDIRATNLQKKDIWVVEPSPEAGPANVSKIIHGTDAELKTLRQLEHEFERNPALKQAGGKLVGYVSQEVCHSCRAALDAFSEKYNVDITVHYLQTTGLPSSPVLADTMSEDSDIASKAGSVILRDVREKTAMELLTLPELAAPEARALAATGGVAWPDKTILERLAAAEAGDLGLPAACQGE
ncbi:hypothetical protein FIV34_02260 [Luteibacter pinisoli]|uniref:Uncharacterized protein n=2 Tax=Luteibacter pinisoli TaxID=2589080 RepID=A0A4Y5YYP0_9GAMM|nr:hypothetical protein FIV34_02260 [Luteibacter pinisoli]